MYLLFLYILLCITCILLSTYFMLNVFYRLMNILNSRYLMENILIRNFLQLLFTEFCWNNTLIWFYLVVLSVDGASTSIQTGLSNSSLRLDGLLFLGRIFLFIYLSFNQNFWHNNIFKDIQYS